MQFFTIAHASIDEASDGLSGTPGVLASLGLNRSLFFFQLINFAIVAVIIWFLILKPLTKKMTERQKMIDDSIDNAKKIQDNLQISEQKYQQRVDEAKVEANKILEKTVAEADQLSLQLKTKAKQEIEILVEQAKLNIRMERDEMSAGLKKETAGLVMLALEKILSEKMTGAKDKQLTEEMVSKLK